MPGVPRCGHLVPVVFGHAWGTPRCCRGFRENWRVAKDGADVGDGQALAPIVRIYLLHRRQWVVVVAVALTIVVVNKAVIHDRGSSLASLGMVAFFVGLAAAHLAGWVGITPRVPRDEGS